MIVTMMNAQSLDGKLTRGSDPHVPRWSSAEDGEKFRTMLATAPAIVMGRKTYEAMGAGLELATGKLYVVTAQPERYSAESKSDKLVFTAEQPAALVARLASEGCARLLLIGGGRLNGAFLAAGVVDEILATVEPWLFGQGTSLSGDVALNVRLTLQEVTRLNRQGSLLLRYRVEKLRDTV